MNKIVVISIIFVIILVAYFYFLKKNNIENMKEKKSNNNKNLYHYEKMKKLVDKFIVNDKDINDLPEDLRNLVTYVLEGGKRVRGVIILSVFQKYNNQDMKCKDYVRDMALAMEYVHCASLILDDIMDKDTERRGKTCLHVKYSEPIAQLVAIQLLTISFDKLFSSLDLLSKENPYMNRNLPIIICKNISNNLKKITTGQFKDITINKFDISESINNKNIGDAFKKVVKNNSNIECEELIHLKTSTLFEMCFVGSYVISCCEMTDIELEEGILEMKKIGRSFGLLFQIADDFDDVEQDMNRDGKNAIMNYVINRGEKEAYNKYNESVNTFIDLCAKNRILSEELIEIVDYLSSKVDKKIDNKLTN